MRFIESKGKVTRKRLHVYAVDDFTVDLMVITVICIFKRQKKKTCIHVTEIFCKDNCIKIISCSI